MRVRKTFFQMLAEDTEEYRRNNYMLSFKNIGRSEIEVTYNNGAFLGNFYVEVDGFWVFQPHTKGGCWSGQVLKLLWEKLQELNREWETELKESLQSKQK